jgi:hypothetical protein
MPTGYRLYFGTDGAGITPPTNIVSGTDLLNVLTYDPNPDMTAGTTYYWQVVPYNANGNATACPIWSFTALPAGYAQIGTGTSTQIKPFGTTWGYERSAALYTAAQVGSIGALDEIAWYCAATTTTPVPYKIYAKSTTDAAMTAMTWPSFVASAQLVKEGTYSFSSSGWKLFELDSPFPYISGNLIIGVETNYGGGGGGSGHTFYYSTGTTGSHQYWNTDNSPSTANGTLNTSLPNVLLHLGELSDTPELAVSPTSWDFGQNFLNIAATKQFTISNIGGGTLNLSSVVASGSYYSITVAPTDMALTTGESTTFTVQYLPTVVGDPHTATVTIAHNAGADIVIDLSGSCFDPTIASFPYTENFDGTWEGSPAAPSGWTVINANNDSYVWSQANTYITPTHSTPYAAHGMGNTNDYLITPPVDLTGINARMKWWDKVESANQANSYKVMLSTTDTQISSFVVELGNIVCTNTTWTEHTIDLDAYAGQTVYLAFYQYASGSTVYGFGIDDFLLEEIPAGPVISVNPDVWDFGTQIIRTTTPKEFTITNIGVGSLDISSLTVTGTGFALAEAFTSEPLLENESVSFTVNFNPQAAGAHTGNIAINDNRGLSNIALSGDCLDPTVYTIPWTEGFEENNVNDTAIFGWMQESITGTNAWTANDTETSYNREPKSGDWNAYLRYGNTRWMFKPVQLQAGTVYRATVWARQNTAIAANATLTISYGAEASAAGMTETILAATGLVDGEYQRLGGTFTPATSGIHHLGILATITSAPWYVSIDDISIEFPEPVAPEPAIATFPLNGSTTLLNPKLQWAPSMTGEPASSFKVYMNQGGIFSEDDLVYEGEDLQYQTTGLTYGQTYYWKVLPTNAYGSDPTCPTWTFNTPGTDQLAEGFEPTTFPPLGWANGSSGNWTRSTSTPLFEGTASAYKSSSTSAVYVLSTPMLTIDSNSTIDFYTRASNVSQVLKVVYSEDRSTWTQIGEDVTYDASGIWYPVSINLSTLNGSDYYIGFQTPTQTSSGSIYVDHVIGPNITPLAPDAPTLSAPSDAAPNQSPNPKLTWTAATTGGIPTGYNIYLDTNAEPTTLIGSSTTTSYDVNTALNWGDTYYWKVEATNAAGTSNASTVRSFTVMSDPTIYDLPYLVDFGTSTSQAFPPTSWTQLGGFYPTTTGTSSQWGRGNWLNGATGNNAAKINIYGTTRNGWLVTPPIAIPADGHELRFDLGLTKYNNAIPIEDDTAQEDDKFMVLVSDSANMSNATILQEWNNAGSSNVFNAIPHTGTSVIIDLTGHTGAKYFAFYGESTIAGGDNDLFVDNVMVREIPIGLPDPVTLVSPADEATYLPVEGFTLNWTPAITGGTPSSYKVYLDTNPDPGTLIATETGFTHEIVTPLAYGSTYYWKVIAHNSSGDADASTIFSFETVPEGLVVLGDGTANNSLPVNAFYGYTYSQTIYPQTSINLADQRIEKISYYWNGSGVGTNTGGWTVYMGHTSATEFASTTDWIPLTGLTQVFTGNVPIPATAGWIEIPLQTPFLYNNTDNLVIAVDENTSGYDASGRYFYTTDTGTNSVSIRYQNDSTNPDPATPPTGTLVSAYPNIRMQLGDIPTGAPGPVTLISPENEATNLPIEGFNLTWAPNLIGGYPETYAVLMSRNEGDLDNDHYWDGITDTSFDPTQVEQDPIAYEYGETWYWTVMAFNEEGDAYQETPFSFTIMDDPRILSLPYSENFDGVSTPGFPEAWTGYKSNNSSSLYTSTSYAVSSPNNVYMYAYTASETMRLITPEVLVPMNSIKLSFSARGGSTGYNLLVGTVDALDETGTFTELASIDLTNTHTIYSVPFGSYTGTDRYICFQHGLGGTYRSIYIDDVAMDELVPNDLAVVSLTGYDYGFQNTDVTHTVTVKNNGTNTQNSYTVYLKSVDGRIVLASETITEELLPDATKAIELTWAPSALAALEIYGEVVLAGDVVPVNNVSETMTFTTHQEGILMEGFEAGVIPANWTVINADGGSYSWEVVTTNPRTGNHAARIHWETANDDWLITPPLQLSANTTDVISFWMSRQSTTWSEPYEIKLSTTNTEIASFTVLLEAGSIEEPANAYIQKSFNLDAYGDAVVYVAIRYLGENDFYLYVDDFVGPPIYTPESLTQPVVTINKTGSNVVLDWNLIPYATNYQIHAADAPEGPYTLVTTVTGNTYSTSATGKKFFKVIASTGTSRTISQQPLSLEQQLLKDEADRAAHGKY